MQTTTSINDVPIRLTDERWQHIIGQHPELVEQQEKLLETIVTDTKLAKQKCGIWYGFVVVPVSPSEVQ
jgi:hypothetical protein